MFMSKNEKEPYSKIVGEYYLPDELIPFYDYKYFVKRFFIASILVLICYFSNDLLNTIIPKKAENLGFLLSYMFLIGWIILITFRLYEKYVRGYLRKIHITPNKIIALSSKSKVISSFYFSDISGVNLIGKLKGEWITMSIQSKKGTLSLPMAMPITKELLQIVKALDIFVSHGPSADLTG